ncbi:MAG: MerR family transcriptional regulator [Maricaulaceae bacterium]
MAKSPRAYRTIGEAAAELDLQPHVLRYWEQKLSALRPMKRAGGRRYYRPQDIALLRVARTLLHERGWPFARVKVVLRRFSVRLLLKLYVEPAPDARPLDDRCATVDMSDPEAVGRQLRDRLVGLEACRARLDAAVRKSAAQDLKA